MKTRDFRLGNWITDQEYNFQITKITDHEIEAGALTVTLIGLEADDWGIPLSPEWLERFGFQMDDSLNQGILDDHWFIGNESDYLSWYLISKGTNAIIKRHIMSVHQLQNLIYALTGEELTLKKP